MNVDEHIAEANRLTEKASDHSRKSEYRIADSAQASAHAAIASALLARYPGYGYAGCQPGEYEGKDLP